MNARRNGRGNRGKINEASSPGRGFGGHKKGIFNFPARVFLREKVPEDVAQGRAEVKRKREKAAEKEVFAGVCRSRMEICKFKKGPRERQGEGRVGSRRGRGSSEGSSKAKGISPGAASAALAQMKDCSEDATSRSSPTSFGSVHLCECCRGIINLRIKLFARCGNSGQTAHQGNIILSPTFHTIFCVT